MRVRMGAASGGYAVIPDKTGDFSDIIWNHGITAPGSSGSGLWVEEQGVHYLNGTLLGGASDCSHPQAPDEYTRLERFYPYISRWIGMTNTPPSLYLLGSNTSPLALREGVIVARYLQGIRGSALVQGITGLSVDTQALEISLAALAPHLDIDGDGTADASTDAMLVIRYLLGLRGAPLLQGLDMGGATRSSTSDIQAYIETLLISP